MPLFQVPNFRRRQLTFALAPAFLLASSQLWAASSTVVISQVYTAGGNSGATYNADYVELFNLSSSPVSLSGWSLQYFSATATATSTPVVIPITGSFTLQPGQRYLVQATPGTVGANLTNNADQTASGLAMGAAAGRIYVTNTTTALSNANGCPTNYVDFVGYGTTANCFETARAPQPSVSQPIARTNACVDADNNASEFALTSTAARGSASTPTPCSATVISNAAVNPSSVNAGQSTLLTATGTVGLTVTADLSSLGGSKTQPLYDDGTNGDVTASDGTYSFNIAVPSSTASSTYGITVRGTNSGSISGTASTTLTVTAPVAFVAIHSIQGNTPGTSPYNGQTVMTHGIITSVRSAGYYIQARDSEADTDPHTSEGIIVFTGSGKVPASAIVGTEIQVSGTITLYPSSTTTLLPGAELSNPTGYTVLTTSNPLPTPITLTTTNPGPNGGIQQLPYLQDMRVSVPSLTVTQPTDGTLVESAETYTSNGQFWGEVTGLPRPTREAGLEVRDPFTATQSSTIPRFDDDPETFLVDSLAAGNSGGPLNLVTGAVLSNVTGVIDTTNYSGLPALVIDAANRPTVASAGMAIVAAPAAGAGQVTIGDQNMERFYNATADTAGAVVLTPAAYQLRLSKASLGVRNVLNSPDILALEEMENLQTLTDLSNKISADAVAAGQVDPQYQPYLVQGNDPSAINVAFLVKPSKVNVLAVDQFGKTATYTAPGGAATLLNDRPPLVLHAGIRRANGATDYPVTVIVNHLRSLNSITDPSTGATVRAKREAQAEYLANLIQGYQANGEHVIVVGDFNAFDVNDGLVDSLGVIKGNPAPASQDVVAGASGLVNPVLVDAAPTNVPAGAYSYVFEGYAQSIDHFLVTQDIAGIITTQPAHWNADFPVVFRNDATRPEVSSDHDGIVGYLAVPAAQAGQAQATFATAISKQADGSYQVTVTVTNSGTAAAQAVQVTAASLGNSNTTSALPVQFGDIAVGGSKSMVLNFPASAGASGSRAVEKIVGAYSTGTFGTSLRITLP
ncbi:MAG: lamin tail domain-containing protein [Janthinobacterium lividum]